MEIVGRNSDSAFRRLRHRPSPVSPPGPARAEPPPTRLAG